MKNHIKAALAAPALVLAMAAGAVGVMGAASATNGNGQETCAASDGWVKYDGLSGHEFTYPEEVPEGATVENCVKYSTTVVYGTGITVVSDGKHEISHASFRVTEPEVCEPPLVGTPPDCVEPEEPEVCEPPTTGTPPNCTTPPVTPETPTETPTTPTETPTVPTETPTETPSETPQPEPEQPEQPEPDKPGKPDKPDNTTVTECVDGVFVTTVNGEVISESGSCDESLKRATVYAQEEGL
jgi:hypothetical protein